MNPTTPDTTVFNPYIRQQHLLLRRAYANVRWLKRSCVALLVLNVLGGVALWSVKHPHTLGF